MEVPQQSTPEGAAPELSGHGRALVVAGGDPWSGALPRFGRAIDLVVAADSGVELALQLGLPISVVIGDLDSASPESLAEAVRLGARIEKHPVDKDATDLELALDLACASGHDEVVVVGGWGGRISHLLAIATLLAGERYSSIRISWLVPAAEVHVVSSGRPLSIEGERGDLVSLIPIAGDARGVTTSGLRWPLHDESLSNTTTRGVSNQFIAQSAEVKVSAGTLLVIHEEGAE